MIRAAFIARLGIPQDPQSKVKTFGFSVRGFPIVGEPELGLHYVHVVSTHAARLEQRWVCTECGIPVEVLEKGLVIDGRIVPLTKDELASLVPNAPGKEIGIQHTVEASAVHPFWYDNKSYYLVPEMVGDVRAYSNLLQALDREKLLAVVTFLYYDKLRTGTVEASNDGLILRFLLYQNQIRAREAGYGIHAEPEKLTPPELTLSRQLVRRLWQPFEYRKVVDPYPERLLALAHKKLKQKKSAAAPSRIPDPNVINLMEQLTMSIKNIPEKKAKAPKPTKSKTKKKHAG